MQPNRILLELLVGSCNFNSLVSKTVGPFDLQHSSSTALAAYNTIWGSPKSRPLWVDYQPSVADKKLSKSGSYALMDHRSDCKQNTSVCLQFLFSSSACACKESRAGPQTSHSRPTKQHHRIQHPIYQHGLRRKPGKPTKGKVGCSYVATIFKVGFTDSLCPMALALGCRH